MKKGKEPGHLLDAMVGEAMAGMAPPWTPEPFPELADDFELDFETTGLAWWEDARPIGAAVTRPDGSAQYLSWGHKTDGPRHDESTAKRWLLDQAKNRRLTNVNSKFDAHQSREWGADLEGVCSAFSDVSHHAALLDDHRRTFSLDALCKDYLTDIRKITAVGGFDLDPSRMADYHPAVVAVRACADVLQVRALKEMFRPMLADEGLGRVLPLEDDCLWATVEMERNGALIDVEKLITYRDGARQAYETALRDLHRIIGLRFNPESSDDWARLLRQRRIEWDGEVTVKGKPSFAMTELESIYKKTGDEAVALGIKAAKLNDLLSKYLDKYAAAVGPDGILRFSLHQLRSDEGGTVSGRYSASGVDVGRGKKKGFNPQQILALEKQLDKYGPEYIIRDLFIAAPGKVVLSADADQIEYRLFAHYAKNPKILAAYKENPRLSFHDLVHAMLLPYKPDLPYKGLKNMNFMEIYGGGIVKLGTMLGFVSGRDADDLMRIPYKERLKDKRLEQTLEVQAVYDRELPEVKPMIARVMRAADERGVVRTFLGRRSRFERFEVVDFFTGATVLKAKRGYKALNCVVQGGAGDLMKTKLVETRRAIRLGQLDFTMRLTIHDQIVGDAPAGSAKAFGEFLDRQSYPELRVPILWSVEEGASLRACDQIGVDKKEAKKKAAAAAKLPPPPSTMLGTKGRGEQFVDGFKDQTRDNR